MTVTLTKPAEPAPLTLARRALAEVAKLRDHTVAPSHLAYVLGDLTRALEQMVTLFNSLETTTEFGVFYFSRTAGRHVTEPCRDRFDAQSVLTQTRRRLDVGAQLAARVKLLPLPAGDWVVLSAEDARVALEADR
ncbi:hypothetical protein GCM10023085_46070 [Actinomadura viridis]|uniref:Uncharacterized protein n=1 Tax=Actinomadura viridis TaxID=58110 RepID=A0A931DKX9_9ACTN|nr:hypothetical protein [Actinomadura viridis]MBG6089967.1 hypothetical protein [Actinomadura viridis]